MGKKLIQQSQALRRQDTPSKFLNLSQDPEIMIENTQNIVKNTSAILARRPQLIQKTTNPRIQKQRKARIYNPDDRFANGHIKRYFLFPFYYSTLFPYFKISWKVWKPNSVYKKMAQFLSNIPGLPDKTPIQCKSFDQRKKEENYLLPPESEKMDLFQSAITYLKEAKLNNQERDIIKNYIRKMNEKSSYINFLQDDSQMEQECLQESEVKKENESFIPLEKREETSIDSPNVDEELIFNQFLDIEK